MVDGLKSGTYYHNAYGIFDATSPLYSCVDTTNDNVGALTMANDKYAPAGVTIDHTVFLNGKAATVADAYTDLKGTNTTAPVKYVDKDGDKIIDSYFATAYTYAKVTGVDAGKAYLTVIATQAPAEYNDLAGYCSVALDKIVGAELKTGDYVMIYKNYAEGLYYAKVLDIVTGTITKYDADKTLYINGEKYEYSWFANEAAIEATIGRNFAALNGTTFTFYVDQDATDKFVVSTAINEQTAYGNYGVVYNWNNTHKTVELYTENNAYATFTVKYFNGKDAYYTAIQPMDLETYELVYYYAVDGGIALYTADAVADTFGVAYNQYLASSDEVNFVLDGGVLYAAEADWSAANPITIDYTDKFVNDRSVVFVTFNYNDPTYRTGDYLKFIAYKNGEQKMTVKDDLLWNATDEVLYVYDNTITGILGGYNVFNVKAAKLFFDKPNTALDDGALERDGEWLIFNSFTNITVAEGKWTYTMKFIDQAGAYKTVTYTTENGVANLVPGYIYLIKYSDAENNVASSVVEIGLFDLGQEALVKNGAVALDVQIVDGKLVGYGVNSTTGALVVKTFDAAKTFIIDATGSAFATMGIYDFNAKFDTAISFDLGAYTVVVGGI